MLKKIFDFIRNKKNIWLGISKGKHLEDRLEEELRKNNFIPLRLNILTDKKQWLILKKEILQKNNNKDIINNFPSFTYNTYFRHPYGSQNYPDFLIFTNNSIIPIELKTSRKNNIKPMWNSNLPKSNCIYIFASFGKKDITFFKGNDVIEEKIKLKLLNFFVEIKKIEKKFIDELESNERGWKLYVRTAFEQNKSLLSINGKLNYFLHPWRKEIENRVCEWLKNITKN